MPRPGHADLPGAQLYGADDLRDVIERASARETAARVACGAVARRLLEVLGCQLRSHVVAVGDVTAAVALPSTAAAYADVDADPLRCLDAGASAAMRAAVEAAGGRATRWAASSRSWRTGFPPGVGSYAQGDRRLGARLGGRAHSPSPPSRASRSAWASRRRGLPGSQVHDEIVWSDDEGYGRASNRAGGVEGGISTGLPIVVRAAMKPIATLMSPLRSVRLGTHKVVEAHVERSDVCAVPAAAVVGEAAVALCLAAAVLERFGGATAAELAAAVAAFRAGLRRL